MRSDLLGHGDLAALLAVLRLGDDAYGVSIAREIAATGSRSPALASLYLTLDRLETRGLLRSEWGDPTPERGGRAKRYFHATPKGLAEVRATRRALTRLWTGIPELGRNAT